MLCGVCDSYSFLSMGITFSVQTEVSSWIELSKQVIEEKINCCKY